LPAEEEEEKISTRISSDMFKEDAPEEEKTTEKTEIEILPYICEDDSQKSGDEENTVISSDKTEENIPAVENNNKEKEVQNGKDN
ncbi:MAG: hypothetical protein ACI4QR_01895, partial [Eubacteriales bacterium]